MSNFRSWLETSDTLDTIASIYTTPVRMTLKRNLAKATNAKELADLMNGSKAVKKSFLRFTTPHKVDNEQEYRSRGFLSNGGADTQIATRAIETLAEKPHDIAELIHSLENHKLYHFPFISAEINPYWFENPKPENIDSDIERMLAHELSHIDVLIRKAAKGIEHKRTHRDLVNVKSNTGYFTLQDEPDANANNIAYEIVNNRPTPFNTRTALTYWKLPPKQWERQRFFKNLYAIASKRLTPQEFKTRLDAYIEKGKAEWEEEVDRDQETHAVDKVMKRVADFDSKEPFGQRASYAQRAIASNPSLAPEIEKRVGAYKDKFSTGSHYISSPIMWSAVQQINSVNDHPNIDPNKKKQMIDQILSKFSPKNVETIMRSVSLSLSQE
jgi:hypothetical protein